jgi:predicted MFS family arabinose efflux permease
LILRRSTRLASGKSIPLLLTAWCLSYGGDLAAFTAASVYAYHEGGAGLVAVLGLLKALPGAFLVPLISSGSDRVRRERLLIATVVARALLLAAAVAAMTGGGQGLLVVVLVGLESTLSSAFRQLQASLMPWLARTPDELTSANSTASVLQAAAVVGGATLAAGLLVISTAQTAMAASCAFVAVAALALLGVKPLASPAPARGAGHLKRLGLDLAAGFRAGICQRDALAIFVPAAAQNFGSGVLNVLTVVIAVNLFNVGSASVGWLNAVLGAAGVLVGPLAVMLVRGQRVARSFIGGVAGWGAPMIVLAFTHAPYWPFLMFGLIGAANVFDVAGEYSSLQQVIPSRLMGSALGVRRGALLLSTALGAAVTPLLIDAWGARGTLLATGLLLVVLAAASLPRLTAIDGKIAAPGPDLALLRRVSFFGPLPFAIVEHLARELQTTTYEPGDVIIREGEPGDRFYIIAAGQVSAAKDGHQLREMGTGDSFGEIALLRQIPRTATVTALSQVETRFLAREEFLAAAGGSQESVKSAEEVVVTRLQTD